MYTHFVSIHYYEMCSIGVLGVRSSQCQLQAAGTVQCNTAFCTMIVRLLLLYTGGTVGLAETEASTLTSFFLPLSFPLFQICLHTYTFFKHLFPSFDLITLWLIWQDLNVNTDVVTTNFILNINNKTKHPSVRVYTNLCTRFYNAQLMLVVMTIVMRLSPQPTIHCCRALTVLDRFDLSFSLHPSLSTLYTFVRFPSFVHHILFMRSGTLHQQYQQRHHRHQSPSSPSPTSPTSSSASSLGQC